MGRPVLLDLFCCQGGAAMGYHRAGFDVVGVDIDPQPRYPFEFHQGDAIDFLLRFGGDFALRVASPPCQRYSLAQRIRGREHPDLIGPTRHALQEVGGPYVIENVEDARPELIGPVLLCGPSFGLRTYRHRLFESSMPLTVPVHQDHGQRSVKMGRPVAAGDFYHAVGNFSGVDMIRRDLGVEWMNRDGIRECIPPAYTEHIGRQILDQLRTGTGHLPDMTCTVDW